MEHDKIPMGFGMAPAMNPEAMQKFALLHENEKQKIINGTHTVSSRDEMRQYVENIKTAY